MCQQLQELKKKLSVITFNRLALSLRQIEIFVFSPMNGTY